MTNDRYPIESLDENDDDGRMPENVEELAVQVVGHRITKVESGQFEGAHPRYGFPTRYETAITLDNGTRVLLADSSDCCAYTDLEDFFLNVDLVDHVILGVGTTEGYTKWHVYADAGDVLTLDVGWSCGNPFYYGYGFDIAVVGDAS